MALNSSCSKAILGTPVPMSVPKSAPNASNTPNFFFTTIDRKGCNFAFPKLVQNQGLFPLHAVPSETMVDLDNLVHQTEQQQPKEPKIINLKFQLHCDCCFGEQFMVVGNDPTFGSWNPAKAIPMTWSEGHVWKAEMAVPVGKYQYKIILKRRNGEILWQPGPDRFVQTWEAMNRITVSEDWENARLQKVTEDEEVSTKKSEEEKVDQPKDSQMKSKTSNLAENLDSAKENQKSDASKGMKNIL
ncbi:hypothetical protein VNO80_07364 [Phaseolus coccineus]|uniref:CBM20 domain-containing protein n=1 Tax=Phaseolus coccineus TaxID=3886 RepID=A0AAN9NNC3_PHACN